MDSLTIILPAYKDARSITDVYKSVKNAVIKNNINDHEIIVVTDSLDNTYDIVQDLAKSDPNIQILHRPINTGLGSKYREALKSASKKYVTWVPTHGLTEDQSISEIFSHLGNPGSVISYPINMQSRPLIARFVSKSFVILCNILFGLNIKYYNGISIHQLDTLKKIPLTATNNAILAEMNAYILKSGVNYIEIPQTIKDQTNHKGRSFNMDSALKCFRTVALTAWNIRIKGVRIS
ncbi:MAG: glycosyltransferase [Candidatus Pacebacteria bacterium]|nr:glycosyltransferase [Candidatus Paceibacterota bacterium]